MTKYELFPIIGVMETEADFIKRIEEKGANIRRLREEQKAQDTAEMKALTEELERNLKQSPCSDQSILDRQSRILDSLMTAVMRRTLSLDRDKGSFDTKSIELALRIQKQCNDTVKTASAVNYMHALTSKGYENGSAEPLRLSHAGEDIPFPLPRKIEEQNE